MIQKGRIVTLLTSTKQTYAQESLTNALLKLLKEKDIRHITVSELAKEAAVTRVTFYRNYKRLEDVLQIHVEHLITSWYQENKLDFEKYNDKNNRNDLLLSSLFGHLIDFSDVYDILHQQGLLVLIIPSLKKILTPQSSEANFGAYLESFFLYGMYAWILEWYQRGKQESDSEMEVWLRQLIIR